MSAPWCSGDWDCGAGFAQMLNGTLSASIFLTIPGMFLTQNVIDLVAASLLIVEKNARRILGTFSLAVDVDNV